MDEIQSNILQAIEILIDEKLSELQFNTKVEGLVVDKEDDRYIIDVGSDKWSVEALYGEYEVGDVVLILIMNNNKHITEERRIIGLK